MASQRVAAQMIAQRQKIAEKKQELILKLLSGELPANLIMDKRLPLTDQERQAIWNRRAASSGESTLSVPSGRKEEGQANASAIASLISKVGRTDGPITGTENQIRGAMQRLQSEPEWQTMDADTRAVALRHLFGEGIASRYINSVKDTEALNLIRRKQFDDEYQTGMQIDREKRQAAARLAGTESEMLHRGLLNRDIVIRPEGLMEKNPDYNPSNPINAAPQYIPASAATKATVARYWDSVMPGRANPLHPEELLRIQIAEENPELQSQDIVNKARARLADMSLAKEKGISLDDVDARRRLAAYVPPTTQGPVMNTAPAAVFPSAPVEGPRVMPGRSATPTPYVPMGPSGNTEEMRLGEKLRLFGQNMMSDLRAIPKNTVPRLEAQALNISNMSSNWLRNTLPQFLGDITGSPTPIDPFAAVFGPAPAPAPMYAPEDTSSYQVLPDWLK